MPVAQLLNSRFPNCYEQFIKINEPIIHSANRKSHLKHGNLYEIVAEFSAALDRENVTRVEKSKSSVRQKQVFENYLTEIYYSKK